MRNEITETGKSVEEAINSACVKLGCDRDECEWEILDLPKRGFLGLKNIPAKVRVSVEVPDKAPPPPLRVSAPAAPVREKQEPVRTRENRPRQEKKPELKKEAHPPVKPAPAPAKPVPAPAKPARDFKQERKAESEVDYSITAPGEELISKANTAAGYLTAIIGKMDLPGAYVEPVWEENGVCLKIKGEGLGMIIGRRGETLDSLQYLCGLVANRMEGEYLRVTVDCGDYRVKRKATLEALAKKLSAQVIKTETSKALEPMNPFERRIIHATVSTIEGVSSTSIGEEPNRRVVITSPNAKNTRRSFSGRDRDRNKSHSPIADRPSWPDKGAKGDQFEEKTRRDSRDNRPPSGRSRDRDRDRRSGGRDNRERTGAYQPSKEPGNPPTEAENKPLYGKIDLE